MRPVPSMRQALLHKRSLGCKIISRSTKFQKWKYVYFRKQPIYRSFATTNSWPEQKPAEVAEPKSTDNGEPRKNRGEKPGKAAEKRLEEWREATTAGERPPSEKATSDGSGRDSEVR